MITQQEINTYVKSQEKFQLECERVCSIMMLFDSRYKFVTKFEIKDNLVKCACEIHNCGNEYIKWYVTFPIEFLEKSNKELKQYVDKLIKEKEEQEKEEVKNQETEDVI